MLTSVLSPARGVKLSCAPMSLPFAKYAAVVCVSMVKPVFAAPMAFFLRLHPIESILLMAIGIVSTSFLIATFGERVRPHLARLLRRKPHAKERTVHPRIRAIWDRFGMAGIALITPVLLSPPGGAVAAVALSVPRRTIVLHMAWAGILWGTIYTTLIHVFSAHVDPAPLLAIADHFGVPR